LVWAWTAPVSMPIAQASAVVKVRRVKFMVNCWFRWWIGAAVVQSYVAPGLPTGSGHRGFPACPVRLCTTLEVQERFR